LFPALPIIAFSATLNFSAAAVSMGKKLRRVFLGARRIPNQSTLTTDHQRR
jgi:hypothetical protein